MKLFVLCMFSHFAVVIVVVATVAVVAVVVVVEVVFVFVVAVVIVVVVVTGIHELFYSIPSSNNCYHLVVPVKEVDSGNVLHTRVLSHILLQVLLHVLVEPRLVPPATTINSIKKCAHFDCLEATDLPILLTSPPVPGLSTKTPLMMTASSLLYMMPSTESTLGSFVARVNSFTTSFSENTIVRSIWLKYSRLSYSFFN